MNLGALNPVAEGKKCILFLLPPASCPLPFFGNKSNSYFNDFGNNKNLEVDISLLGATV